MPPRPHLPEAAGARRLGWFALVVAAVSAGAHARLPLPPLGGQASEERFGASLALGDADGDGHADLLVAAPQALGGRGRLSLYRGRPDGLSPSPDFTFEGSRPGERLGEALAFVGDLDGDGRADFAAGAPGYIHAPGEAPAGRVVVLFGEAAAPWLRTAELTAGAPGDALGQTLGGPGDVDGDGFSEVLVGAPAARGGAGRVELYRGGPALVQSAPAWTHEGDPGERLGERLGAVWDVDGDGLADVLVGHARGATLWSGAPAELDTLASPVTDEPLDFAAPMVGVGDLDGDGAAELELAPNVALGDPDGDGVPDLGRLGPDGLDVTAGATGALLETVACGCGSEDLALAVGDIDGDGVTDLVFGAPTFPVAGLPSGAVFPSLARPERALAVRTFFAPHGLPPTAVGDVDDDGFDDLLVSGDDGPTLVLGAAPGAELRTQSLALPALGADTAIVFADFDTDGLGDLAVATLDDEASSVTVLSLRGPALQLQAEPGAGLGRWLAAGDFDGDGLPDLLVGADNQRGRATAAWHRGRLGGLHATPDLVDDGLELGAPSPRYVSVGDLDARAGADLITFSPGLAALLEPLSAAGPLPSSSSPLPLGPPLLTPPLAAGDLNDDGHDDLLFAPPTSPARALFGRPPTPSGPAVTLGPELATPPGAALVPVGDVDGDGKMDAVATAPLRLLRGPDLDESDARPLAYSTPITFPSILENDITHATPAGDIDGDGRADLLLHGPRGTWLIAAPAASRLALGPQARDQLGERTLLAGVATRLPGRFRVDARRVSLSGLPDAALEVEYAIAGAPFGGDPPLGHALSEPTTAGPLSVPVTSPKLAHGLLLRWRARARAALRTAPLQAVTPWTRDDIGPRTATLRLRPDVPLVAWPDRYDLDQGAALAVAAPGLLSNDTGAASLTDASTLALTVAPDPVSPPARGRLTLFPNGAFAYVPNGDAWGEDHFVYRVTDDAGQSATADVTLAIRPVEACFGAQAEPCRATLARVSLARRDGSRLPLRCTVVGGALSCATDDGPACPEPP